MTKEVLEVKRGKTIYKVEAEQEYTTAEMTDLIEYCDPNNWGRNSNPYRQDNLSSRGLY